jgi:hypothetical protein
MNEGEGDLESWKGRCVTFLNWLCGLESEVVEIWCYEGRYLGKAFGERSWWQVG